LDKVINLISILLNVTYKKTGHPFKDFNPTLKSTLFLNVEGSIFIFINQNSGQSNPTFTIEANSTKYILRKKPKGKLLPNAHAVTNKEI
jgi:hypothetical protein